MMTLLAGGLSYFTVDKFLLDPARDQTRVEQAVEQGCSAVLEEQLGERAIGQARMFRWTIARTPG
jgi:hypothetical protein